MKLLNILPVLKKQTSKSAERLGWAKINLGVISFQRDIRIIPRVKIGRDKKLKFF